MKTRPNPAPDVVLTMQTLSFRPDWTEAYQALLAEPEAFTSALLQGLDQLGSRILAADAETAAWNTWHEPAETLLARLRDHLRRAGSGGATPRHRALTASATAPGPRTRGSGW